MDKRQQRLNVAFTFIILATTMILGASIYYKSYIRFYESLLDLINSVKYYFAFTLEIPTDVIITVTQRSKIFDITLNIPETFEGLQERTTEYGETLIDGDNALEWFLQGLDKFAIASKFTVLLLPIVVGLVLVIIQIYNKPNNKYNRNTLPLKIFKWLGRVLYQPFKEFFIG